MSKLYVRLQRGTQAGFALPTILIASIVMLIVLLTSVSAATSIRVALDEQYYTKLAQEAAEAGQARAEACLEASNFTPTWTNNSRLRPDTDCNGATIAGSRYIASYGNIRTTFVVWAPVTSSPGLVTITVVGTTELIRSSSSTVHQTYAHTLVRQGGSQEAYSTDSSSGVEETCGIVNQHTYCWGNGSYGRLGNGSTATSLTPVKVSRQIGGLAGRVDTSVAVGMHQACTIADARAYCWGSNAYGKLGNNSTTDSSIPVAVYTAGMNVDLKKVVVGVNHACVLSIPGDVYCWGQNTDGQLGTGVVTPESLIPVRVAAIGAYTGLKVVDIATSIHSDSTCAIVVTGSGQRAYCWGQNDSGQLGDNSTTTRASPVPVYTGGVLAGRSVTDISIAAPSGDGMSAHTCAVASGLFYCWGNGGEGVLGNNTMTTSYVPVAVNTSGVLSGKTALEVNVGVWHVCATARDASAVVRAYCWGQNDYGQLGNGTYTTSSVPVAVSVLAGGLQGRTITGLKGGGNRGCVIADQKTFCWGYNYIGQLGDGTTTTRNTPTEATFLAQKVPVINY